MSNGSQYCLQNSSQAALSILASFLTKAFSSDLYLFNAVLNSESTGTRLDFDVWRFRVGSGVYVDVEFNPEVGISVGWKF